MLCYTSISYDIILIKRIGVLIHLDSESYSALSNGIQLELNNIFSRIISDNQKNYLEVSTNLRCGIPPKDVHKIAGPLIDQWCFERLEDQVLNNETSQKLIVMSVISKDSSSLEDILLKVKYKGNDFDVLIDVKSASLEKGNAAGKGSNLTSFRKIRPFYLHNPNSLFLILSIKHDARIYHGKRTGFNIVSHNIFDLKLVDERELLFNKRMGDQFQIKNSLSVHQVESRSTKEFIELIDQKYINSYSEEELNTLLEKIEGETLFNDIIDDALEFMSEGSDFTKKDIIKNLNIGNNEYNKLRKHLIKNDLVFSSGRGKLTLKIPEELV